MSLINQMLKDLDARHEGDVRSRLHREVRALPDAPRASPLRAVLIALLLAAVSAVAAWVYLQQGAEQSSPVTAASAPVAPVVAPPVAAVPVVAAEAVSSTSVAQTESATAAASSAVQPPMPVVDDSSGMKLSATLDRLPTAEPAEKRTAGTGSPRRETASAKPTVAAAAFEHAASAASAPKASPIPQESVPTASAKTASSAPAVAPGAIEKRPPAQQSGREKAEAEYRRALTLVNGARVQEATDLLLDALRHDGGHVAARQLLSRLLIEQRRLDEAMAILAEGLAAQPGQVGWAMSLARLQVERNDLPAAARTLQIVQAYATGNADYQGFAGHIQYRLGNPAAAVSFYRAATAASPSDGRWWLGLGLSLEAMQQSAEARDAFQRARATGSLSGDLATLVDQKLR